MTKLDPEDPGPIAHKFGIAESMAREIVFMNDEYSYNTETPEQRFMRVRAWVVSEIKEVSRVGA